MQRQAELKLPAHGVFVDVREGDIPVAVQFTLPEMLAVEAGAIYLLNCHVPTEWHREELAHTLELSSNKRRDFFLRNCQQEFGKSRRKDEKLSNHMIIEVKWKNRKKDTQPKNVRA